MNAIEKVRSRVKQLCDNGYAVEVVMRNTTAIIAVTAVLLGIAVLLTGW